MGGQLFVILTEGNGFAVVGPYKKLLAVLGYVLNDKGSDIRPLAIDLRTKSNNVLLLWCLRC